MISLQALFYPTIVAAALLAGGTAGFEITQMLKPTAVEYSVSGNSYSPDIDAAMKKYEAALAKGTPWDKALTVDEMINVAYHRFGEEKHTWSRGVGSSFAAGLVNQGIFSTTVRDEERFFEESLSYSDFVKVYDRMFQEGETTTTYFGQDDNFPAHPKVEYTNDEYKEKMGRYVSNALVYLVSPKTILTDESPSGEAKTGIYPTEEGYTLEAELSPIYGTINYKKQMQFISSLKYQPTFDYCHITVWVDKDLNLIKGCFKEKYTAVTSAGVGSAAIGSLTTAYYHQSPPFPFPEVGSQLPPYPSSIE